MFLLQAQLLFITMIQPIELKITFYDTKDNYQLSILPEDELEQFKQDNLFKQDSILSVKYASDIFRMSNGEILETRPGWVIGKLYKSEDDIMPLREVTIAYINRKKIVVAPYYRGEDRAKRLIEMFHPVYDSTLIEDTRQGFRLNDGRVLVLYGSNGKHSGASLYESQTDLDLVDPFNWDLREEEELDGDN